MARWRGAAVAGMAAGGGTAMVLVGHTGIERAEVGPMLCRRRPGAVVGDLGEALPSWSMSAEDAAELAVARRGLEPLRSVVAARRVGLRHGVAERIRPAISSAIQPGWDPSRPGAGAERRRRVRLSGGRTPGGASCHPAKTTSPAWPRSAAPIPP